jgi:hypothetical protein
MSITHDSSRANAPEAVAMLLYMSVSALFINLLYINRVCVSGSILKRWVCACEFILKRWGVAARQVPWRPSLQSPSAMCRHRRRS